MKLTVFHSDKGDCTLLTGKDGKRILADGGMQTSFTATVAPELAKLRTGKGNKKLDLIYVSHIDDDHIGGILQLMDDLAAWKIHDYQVAHGNKLHKAPKSPCPPDIGAIWHNGFHDVLQDNAGPIEDQFAANALVLSGFSGPPDLSRAVEAHQNLAESVKQAVQLSRRIADGQLGIPLNAPAKGKLMMVRASRTPLAIGGMKTFVIAPAKADLEKLREDWNAWLQKSKAALAAIRTKAKADEGQLGTSADSLIPPLTAQAKAAASALVDKLAPLDLTHAAKAIGARTSVTPPNLASLMLFIQEGKKSLLYTGDGYGDDALAGLAHYKLLANGGLHVNVLKVPHHGSEYNMTYKFAKAVTADHYVFCGNGFSTNPELIVLQTLFDSRLGPADKRSSNAQVAKPFSFWFNCDSKMPNVAAQKAHMKKVEAFVAGLVKQGKGKMTARFLRPDEASFTIEV